MPTIIQDAAKQVFPARHIPTPPQQNIPIGNFRNPFANKFSQSTQAVPTPSPIKIPAPGEGLPRILHFCADQSGCAFWRMIWPADELLARNKAVVMTMYQMVLNPMFYQGIDAVRLQRQCTEPQLEFIKMLRQLSDKFKSDGQKGFRIIWEVDDIVCPAQDIPDYNVCKTAFSDDTTLRVLREVVKYVDEITVPSHFMRDHYRKWLNFDKVTVIPNFYHRNWIDRGYNRDLVIENYRKHKDKPRVLYAGSITHFDVANKVGQQDDFDGVVDLIAKDIMQDKKYEWVFFGGIPLKLRQFIGKGIEYHPWGCINDYPQKIKELNVNASIAPLQNNSFCKAKANIKLTEAGAHGVPCIAQNIECYNFDGWKYLFDTGEDMFKRLDEVLNSEESFIEASDFARNYMEGYSIDGNIDDILMLYTTDYASEERYKISTDRFKINNPDQNR